MLFNQITDNDVLAVYAQLKDKYPVFMTTTGALNEAMDAGFSIDCPILVGKANRQILWLYAYEAIFVLDVLDEEQTKGTHWHPNDVKGAVDDIVEFMEGKTDYEMYPFKQI
jgi:hypothetical protein